MFNTKFEGEIFINTAEDVYTFADLFKYIQDNFHTWERSPLMWDLTQFPLDASEEPSKTINEMLSENRDIAAKRTGQRTAYVVTRDYDYGMFRMFCTFSECLNYPFELGVFRSALEAKTWIKSNV